MTKHLLKHSLLFAIGMVVWLPSAYGQVRTGDTVLEEGGVSLGGYESQRARQPQERRTPPPDNAQSPDQWLDLNQAAEDLRQNYRDKYRKSKMGDVPRLGFVVAFFDSESLLDPVLVKGLNRLANMEGLEFKLFKSKENTSAHDLRNKPPPDRAFVEKYKKMEGIETPMAEKDRGGRIAKQYNVTKFPTILYETPDHDVIPFYVPNTLEKVFTRIGHEKREQARR